MRQGGLKFKKRFVEDGGKEVVEIYPRVSPTAAREPRNCRCFGITFLLPCRDSALW